MVAWQQCNPWPVALGSDICYSSSIRKTFLRKSPPNRPPQVSLVASKFCGSQRRNARIRLGPNVTMAVNTLRWMLIPLLFLAFCTSLTAGGFELLSPLDHQVIQRSNREFGSIPIAGRWLSSEERNWTIEARIVSEGNESKWQKLVPVFDASTFRSEIDAPVGGWHRLEVRALVAKEVIAESVVEHVGIGEVFVVAGQSNSANHGEAQQVTSTKRVASFDGKRWQLANDPQPGASGNGGSFIPTLGDEIVKRFDVPVGIVACGIGATSVREWLPAGCAFPNPPTIETRVVKVADGSWQSKGQAFANLIGRMKSLGKHGFRAVLWHQGESDANQRDASRTLPGNLYREYLTIVIQTSRREIEWDAPWFVAQVSYHVPGDESSPEIRDAQAALWKDGIALQGPDSDALKGDLRERNGQGVHFSEKGLKEHGMKWAEKVSQWIERKRIDPK